jgi:hypothetical protein
MMINAPYRYLVANGLEWSRSSDVKEDDAGEPFPMPHEYRRSRW